ncbi:MAG: diaminopimelate epimerase, partial [Luteibaculum sp.]
APKALMTIDFFKYQGTGNDFIVLDQCSQEYNLSNAQKQFLCDRHFGIGSDGILVLSHSEEADFKLEFFNPDASVSFCGNGSRCAAKYFLTKHKRQACTFVGFDGLHRAELGKHGTVQLDIRVKEEPRNTEFGRFINTGAPHVCKAKNNLSKAEIVEEAKLIRWNKEFKPTGTNVNFYEELGEGKVAIRTFEKGVEGETLSCGTGVTAVALCVFQDNPEWERVNIKTEGGHLEVKKDPQEQGVYWLSGSAVKIFSGQITV